MLDARRLQVLSAVVESGSVRGAAAALGYTPSAVSQSVAALERETGTVLLEKAGRGVRPTQAGLLLAEHGRAVVARLEEAKSALDALRAGEAGRLRLAAFFTAGSTLVPQALARFRADFPAVDLDLTVAEKEESLAQLRAGRIDLAVVDGDAAPDDGDDLVHAHLLDDPFQVVLPRDHRLAGRRTIPLQDLADESWIGTVSPRCSCVALVTDACVRSGFTPHFAIEADEFATTVGFVAAGLGVSLVPLLALGGVPDEVRVRRLRHEEPVRRVFAVTRPAASSQPTVRAMVDALRQSARAYLAAAA